MTTKDHLSCQIEEAEKDTLYLGLVGSGSSDSRRRVLLLFPIVGCSSLSFFLRYLDFGVLTQVFLPDVVPVVEPNTSS